MLALLVGRFHALTRAQGELVAALGRRDDVERIACVVTSSDHAGTRRNPLPVETREALLRPALAATGKPFVLVCVPDVPDDDAWPAHVAAAVAHAGVPVDPARTVLFSGNLGVQRLFAAAGFRVASAGLPGATPLELVQRIVAGQPWRADAAPSTIEVFEAGGVVDRLRAIFADGLRTDDGELAEHRHFDSYGAQMDASLAAKLEDLLPWVVPGPGKIVDKGCGTGKLLVELSRRWPAASLVGVELSREFLRRSDENTYAGQDVELILGEAAAQQLAPGTASTIIFSSVMHEVYTYSGYDRAQIDRALESAAAELMSGGRVLIRDGVSPGVESWQLRPLDATTQARFERFVVEFKHGQGAPHRRGTEGWLELSAHLINEFLCKKDYHLNWEIEVHEEYGALTLDGWRAALARAGLRVREARAYANPWIVEHRYRGTVELRDAAGQPLDWPATNAVVVGEKP
jgi:SAM-dependent methyltransferase